MNRSARSWSTLRAPALRSMSFSRRRRQSGMSSVSGNSRAMRPRPVSRDAPVVTRRASTPGSRSGRRCGVPALAPRCRTGFRADRTAGSRGHAGAPPEACEPGEAREGRSREACCAVGRAPEPVPVRRACASRPSRAVLGIGANAALLPAPGGRDAGAPRCRRSNAANRGRAMLRPVRWRRTSRAGDRSPEGRSSGIG